uniref:Uncharacterized protein n=1 Tax=Ditylenchus dipsaci TaxID=166011 RepID=A0A915DYB6_9BILA
MLDSSQLVKYSEYPGSCLPALCYQRPYYPVDFLVSVGQPAQPYYAILLTAVAVRFSNRLWAVCLTSMFSFTILYGVNFAMVKDPWLLFSSTIGFFLRVPDLTPNVGIFWYFFIQIFEHYRLLFLFVFQLNILIYLIPLAATLRWVEEVEKPYLLGVSLLMFVAIFSSYPSYAETALYLPFIAAFFELHKFIRYGLVLGSTLVASLILTPIMWRMWVDTGTGNANFFFAIGWVFSIAQIFIFADLVSAYLRLNLIRNCCEPGTKITDQKVAEIEEKIQSIKLISASPF